MMEISLPLPALVIFVACHLLPVGVTEMETTMQGHTINWTRNEAGAWKPNLPNPLGDVTYEVEGQRVKVVPEDKPYYSVHVNEYLDVPAKTSPDYWSKLKTLKLKHEAFGSDVTVKHEKNKVSFSQTKGQLKANPVVISWQEPAKSDDAPKDEASAKAEK